MAKKKAPNEVNKAEEIRNELKKNPNAKGTEVIEALAKRGIEVAAAQVSNVRTAMNGGAKATKMKGGSADSISSAIEFATKVGGIDKATELLATLKKIKSQL